MAKTTVSLYNQAQRPKNMSGFKSEATDLERSSPSVKKQEGKDLRTRRTKGGKSQVEKSVPRVHKFALKNAQPMRKNGGLNE